MHGQQHIKNTATFLRVIKETVRQMQVRRADILAKIRTKYVRIQAPRAGATD